MFEFDEFEKRTSGFLEFLQTDMQEIKDAQDYLLRQGLEPEVIELPQVYLFGLALKFSHCERLQVSAKDTNGITISAIVKKRD